MRIGNITQALIDAYEHPRIRLTIGGVTVTEDHIGAGSFSIRAGASGGMLEPGGCVVASCQFSILDFDEELTNLATAEGTEVIVEAGYGDSPSNATYDRIGTFYVSSVTLHQFVTTYLCYDGLKRGDEAQWTSYAFPMTVNQIISSAASDAGLTVSQLPTAGGDITVDLRDAGGNQPTLDITCRQALVKALEISGNFGFMDANGELKCGWYSWNAAKSYDWDSYFGADFNAIRQYTGVQVSGGTITGTADYLYTLPENIFVTDDNRAAITARLATALIGQPFVSGQFGVFADPRVEPGDCIQISFKRLSGTITGLLPVAALTFKGSLQMALGCDSESTDEMADLRETATEKSTNAATTADVATAAEETLQKAKDYTDQHGGGSSGSIAKAYTRSTFTQETAYEEVSGERQYIYRAGVTPQLDLRILNISNNDLYHTLKAHTPVSSQSVTIDGTAASVTPKEYTATFYIPDLTDFTVLYAHAVINPLTSSPYQEVDGYYFRQPNFGTEIAVKVEDGELVNASTGYTEIMPKVTLFFSQASAAAIAPYMSTGEVFNFLNIYLYGTTTTT